MKNIKKIVAAGLVLSMSLSMAGCMGGGKLAPSKLAASAKKNGCELYKDADDFADDIEEDDDIEDGIYITVSGSDVKDILKTNDFTKDLYDKSIKNATIVYYSDEDEYGAFIVSFTFGSKKDAQDYYDDVLDEFEDNEDKCADTDSDDGEKNGISYFVYEGSAGWYRLAEGVYINGKTVVVIVGAGLGNDDYNDVIDDVAGCYDIVLPSDL